MDLQDSYETLKISRETVIDAKNQIETLEKVLAHYTLRGERSPDFIVCT